MFTRASPKFEHAVARLRRSARSGAARLHSLATPDRPTAHWVLGAWGGYTHALP
jgi:hypothetical protein